MWLCVWRCRGTHSDGLVQRPLVLLLELSSDLHQVDFTARHDDPGHHLLLRSFTLHREEQDGGRQTDSRYWHFLLMQRREVVVPQHGLGYIPSWLHWVCWQSTAACSQSTPLWRDRRHVMNLDGHLQSHFSNGTRTKVECSFKLFVTQSEEGLLQISLHLLPDALLHVVRTVALIPLKHWRTQIHKLTYHWFKSISGHIKMFDRTRKKNSCIEQRWHWHWL